LKYKRLDEYCLSQLGATIDYKPEWDAFRYLIEDSQLTAVKIPEGVLVIGIEANLP